MREKDIPEDFMAVGVRERPRGAFFDNCILDADAPSRFDPNTSHVTVMRGAVQEKKTRYLERCEEMAGSFTLGLHSGRGIPSRVCCLYEEGGSCAGW